MNNNAISNYENNTKVYLYQKVGKFDKGIERNFIGEGYIHSPLDEKIIIVTHRTDKWVYGNEDLLTQERINIREIKISDKELEKDENGSPIF